MSITLRKLKLPIDAMRISAEEVRKIIKNPKLLKPSKYKAVPGHLDGHRFASQKEKRRYAELKLMQKAGEISDLKLQPRYPLIVNDVKVGVYVGDFSYLDRAGKPVCEDSKGVRTPTYKIKRKLILALYQIEIQET